MRSERRKQLNAQDRPRRERPTGRKSRYQPRPGRDRQHQPAKPLSVNKGQAAARRRPHAKDSTYAWLLFVAVLVLLGLLIWISYNLGWLQTLLGRTDSDSIKTGQDTYLAEIDLSGLNRTEFTERLTKVQASILDQQQIYAKMGRRQETVSMTDLAVEFDADRLFDQAIQRDTRRKKSRKKSWFSKEEEPDSSLPAIQLDFIYRVSNSRLPEAADLLKQKFDQPAQDARAVGFDLTEFKFIFEDEHEGTELDKDQAIAAIQSLVQDGRVVASEIDLPGNHEPAKVTKSMLEDKLGYIAEATTYLPYWSEARNQNIRRACELISGTVIQPGEVFSYNTSLGEQTLANGFAESFAELDGMPIKEIGGGLCQPSTTLFQAAVYADMPIVERHNHGVPSAYADRGTDAMIASWADLRIGNETEYPYAIVADFNEEQGTLNYAIYGPPVKDGCTIAMDPQLVKVLEAPEKEEVVTNPKLQPGEEKIIRYRTEGSLWSTDKVYYKDGVEVDRQHLVDSHYDAYSQKVEKGPALVPTTPSIASPLPTEDPVNVEYPTSSQVEN